MPKCMKCGKECEVLMLPTSWSNYSPANPIYVCEECNKKIDKASTIALGVFLVLFFGWLGGFLIGAPGMLPEDMFVVYLFGGIFGPAILCVILYKVLGG